MATRVQPFAASHSASSSRPAVVVPKVRTSRATSPPATRRTAATTEARSGPLAALAQSGVLEGPRVRLIRGLARTRTTADLGAGDAPPCCHRFHPLWVGAAGGQLIPASRSADRWWEPREAGERA